MGEHISCDNHTIVMSFDGNSIVKVGYPHCKCSDDSFVKLPASLNPEGVKELVDDIPNMIQQAVYVQEQSNASYALTDLLNQLERLFAKVKA